MVNGLGVGRGTQAAHVDREAANASEKVSTILSKPEDLKKKRNENAIN